MFQESMIERTYELEASKAALATRIKEAERQADNHSLSITQIIDYLSMYTCIKDMTPEEQNKQ